MDGGVSWRAERIQKAIDAATSELQKEINRNKRSVNWADDTRIALSKELGCAAMASEVVLQVKKLRVENNRLREALKCLALSHTPEWWLSGAPEQIAENALAQKPEEKPCETKPA